MVKYVFLILNYRTAQLTIKCVEKILELDRVDEIAVCIVDNDDLDEDYNILEKYYADYQSVHVLKTGKNEGFSKGNNIGYQYICSLYTDVNQLIVMNSDVFIEQKNFLSLIDQVFTRTNFFICGPDIYAPSIGMHTNPMQLKLLNGDALSKEQKKLEVITVKDLIRVFTFRSGLYKYYARLVTFYKKINGKKGNHAYDWTLESEDVVLQGSCYIFSNLFLSANEQIFMPETFMYYEENILFARCIKNKWKVVYSPEIYVTHLLEGSSKSIFVNVYKQLKNKNEIKSDALKVYTKALMQWGLFEE